MSPLHCPPTSVSITNSLPAVCSAVSAWCFAAHSAVPRPPSSASTAHCAAECCTPHKRLSSAALTQPCCLALPIEFQPGIFRFSSAPPASTTGIPGSHVPRALSAPGAPVLATPCRPEAAVQHRQGRVVHVDKRTPGGRRRNPGQAQPRGSRVQAPIGYAGSQVAGASPLGAGHGMARHPRRAGRVYACTERRSCDGQSSGKHGEHRASSPAPCSCPRGAL